MAAYLHVSGIAGRPLLLLRGKGVMHLIFEVRACDLRLVEYESLWSLLRRWAAKLWRLILKRGGMR